MRTILTKIQERLSETTKSRYIAENWGQLELETPPLLFPCTLIDFNEVSYSNNLGKTQQAQATVIIHIANIAQNVSLNSPKNTRDSAYEFYDLLESVSSALHGFSVPGTSPLCRKSCKKITRKDGIKEYQLTFTLAFTD